MNNQRRKEINLIKNKISELMEDLETVLNDEHEYYDNMPENLQSSMRASDSEEAIDSLNNAIDSLNDSISNLDDIM